MAESFLDYLQERFPGAPDLGFRRIFNHGHSIFFGKDGKTLLPEFDKDLVFAALFFAKSSIAQAGWELELTSAEEHILRGFLVPPVKLQSFRRQ